MRGRLGAVIPEGLVVSRETGLELWDWDAKEPRYLAPAVHDVVANHGSLLAVMRAKALVLIDAETGAEHPVPRVTAGEWPIVPGSFSPDGTLFVQDLGEAPPRSEAEAYGLLGEVLEAAAGHAPAPKVPPEWSRLAVVSGTEGSVRLAEGRFNDFAGTPVWSADGEWIVFDAPFQTRDLFVCRIREPIPRLVPVKFKGASPGPLVDVSDLVA